jgi:hypothetical protein
MDIQSIKKDSAAIAEGQWVENIPGMGDLTLKVRGSSANYVMAVRARKQRNAPNEDRAADGSLTVDATLRIETEVLYEAVLLDWGGLTDGGQPVKYDSALAKEWLTNPDFRDFADAVVWASGVVSRTTKAVKEKAAKNS